MNADEREEFRKAILALLKGQDVPLSSAEIAHQVKNHWEGNTLTRLEFTNVELLVALNTLWMAGEIKTTQGSGGVTCWVIGGTDDGN